MLTCWTYLREPEHWASRHYQGEQRALLPSSQLELRSMSEEKEEDWGRGWGNVARFYLTSVE